MTQSIRRLFKALRRHLEGATASQHTVVTRLDRDELALLNDLRRTARHLETLADRLEQHNEAEDQEHAYVLQQLRQANGSITDMDATAAQAA